MKWKQQLLGLKAYQPGRTIEEVKNNLISIILLSLRLMRIHLGVLQKY